ncbi:MAG: LysM peptidoglycan-binding domain-containing protein [Verrucomicrobia bacterium]|nr:MAG: LysM peptidoglycan-binding domain-containing protein [Verrucomicrobiota bacterium]
MHPRTLPVKRRPVSNGFFKRIHAVTRNRNQRVATTATAEDLENEDHSARISRGFTIIFLIHVLAIALYFIHLNFLNDHSVAKATPPAPTATSPKPRTDSPPMLGPDDATCIVVAGDNYARIAAREGVDEGALRAANQNKPIAAGLTFKLPPKRMVAKDTAMVVALRQAIAPSADRGLVEVTPAAASEPQRPLPLHPKVTHESASPKTTLPTTTKTAKDAKAPVTKDVTATKTAKEAKATTTKEATAAKSAKDSATTKAAATATKQSYTVKSGDNLYRIAKHYKIDQAALMRANNISDPAKLHSGMALVIPH